MQIQLEMFQEKSEIEILQTQICMLEKSLDKQRKSLYARNGELHKKLMDLQDRFEIMERMLCKGKYGNLL